MRKKWSFRSKRPGTYVKNILTHAWRAAMANSDDLVSVKTAEEALKLSAFFNGVRILSEIPASMPIDVLKVDTDGNREAMHDHPLKQILRYPNQHQTHFNFFEYLFQCLPMYGNAIGVITTHPRTGAVVSIQMIDPRSVTDLRLVDGVLRYTINDTNTGISGIFLADEVIHIRQFSGNGYWGRDILSYAAENLGLSLSTEQFGNTYFKKGGNHKAVIELENSLEDPAWIAFRNRWNSYGDHETPVLEYGMKYKQLSISPEQAQFISSREVGVQDIARWLNLPPHMLKDLSRATFSNIEHQDMQFSKYSLRSLFRNVEQELEHKLIDPNQRQAIKLRFNQTAILRGDSTSRSTYYQNLVTIGVMTRNEVRRLENLKPLEGLDKPLEPANITGKQPTESN